MDKKERIIETAIRLFVNQGFENTPTSQISKEAGVATGTLFHYFKTKEELINAAYLYVKKDMREYIFKDFNDDLGLEENIKYIWEKLLRWGFEKRNENQFLSRFYGSTYIDHLTVEEARSILDVTTKNIELAIKKKLMKDMPFPLFENLTVAIYQSFLKEFYKLKKLDKKSIEFSFKVYWDAIKK